MANNPFDPQIIQVKRTLERGGMAGANKGFGSVRGSSPSSRPAPGPQSLEELDDVDVTSVPPENAQALIWDEASGVWMPGDVASGGGGGGPMPGVKLRRGTEQAMSTNTFTPVNWSIEDWDTDGYWNSGAPTRITIPAGKAGKYLVWTRLHNEAASANMIVSISKNGVSVESSWERQTISGNPVQGTMTVLNLAVGDYVESVYYGPSTSALGNRAEFGAMLLLAGSLQTGACSIYRNAAGTFAGSAANTQQQVLFDTLEGDSTNGAMWSAAAPAQIVAPVAGWYQVSGALGFQSGTSGAWVALQIRVGGTVKAHRGYSSGGSDWPTHTINKMVYATAGQAITLWCENRAGSRAYWPGLAYTYLTAAKVA